MSSNLHPEYMSMNRRPSLLIASGTGSETTTTTPKGDNIGSGVGVSPFGPTSSSTPISDFPQSSLSTTSTPTLKPNCMATPNPQATPTNDAPIDQTNIENTPVENDPRLWSNRKKVFMHHHLLFARQSPLLILFFSPLGRDSSSFLLLFVLLLWPLPQVPLFISVSTARYWCRGIISYNSYTSTPLYFYSLHPTNSRRLARHVS